MMLFSPLGCRPDVAADAPATDFCARLLTSTRDPTCSSFYVKHVHDVHLVHPYFRRSGGSSVRDLASAQNSQDVSFGIERTSKARASS